GNFAPRGWAFCEGQLLPISQNSALFSILGTTYGGDGRTTFALPDLRGRVPMQQGTGPGLTPHRLGQQSGSETHNLSVANLPPHSHAGAVHVSSAAATKSAAAAGDSIAAPGTGSGRDFVATEGFNSTAPNVALSNASVTTSNTGSGTAVTNMQPSLALNYIIALVGTYPSRS
ncbi:MAG: tail fiber protein, partial [Flavobacteriaceae bacterium]|nr:tail fiber protein [Flavobacteriaceae bacterium]